MSIFSNSTRTYLDWASAAPVSKIAKNAFADALTAFGNPSSPHEEGRIAKATLDGSRARIARLAAVKQRAVVFTSGATESNALAIRGRIERAQQSGMPYHDMHVLYLPTMHASVMQNVHELERLGVEVEPIKLAGTKIDLEHFDTQIRPTTLLVCVDAVCGETGIRFDTLRFRRVLDAAHTRIEPVHRAALLVDASQLPLVEPIDHTRLGADLLTLDAQKIGGIRGIGALIVPNRNLITAVTHGGGQEEGLRSGTEPVALAAAFAAALEECSLAHETFSASAREARAAVIHRISASIPDALINEGGRQAPHILNLSLPLLDTDYAIALLDAAGFAVSTKSACETDSEQGSRAVMAYTGDQARAASTIRVSWGPRTDTDALKRFCAVLTDTMHLLNKSLTRKF